MSNVFIDCGAWEGDSVSLFMNEHKGFEVYVFECEPRLKERIEKLSHKLGFKFIYKAVHTSDLPIRFYQGTGAFSESSSIMSSKTTNIDKKKYVESEAVDFSSWICKNFKKSDFIVCKMNIEGAEYDVLEKMIKDGSICYINILYVEWHNTKIGGVSQERHDSLKKQLSELLVLKEWFFTKRYRKNPFENKLIRERNLRTRKVIYTVVLGDYDFLNDPIKYDEDTDYICFTDNPDLKSKVWKIQKYPYCEVELSACKKSRLVKMCPHRFLKNYDVSIYVDASVVLKKTPDMVGILGNKKIAAMPHSQRNNINSEGRACVICKLEKKEVIKSQLDAYAIAGIDIDNTGLYDCSIIIRYHNDPEIMALGEIWWKHLCTYGCRDQISFPVVYKNCSIRKITNEEYSLVANKRKHKRVLVYGFMHICTANQWKDIVLEQIQKIKSYGLYSRVQKIFCGVVGKGDISFLKEPGFEKIELAYVIPDISNFEFLTLEWMSRFCKENRQAYIFYIHTKGISTYGRVHVPPSLDRQANIDDWRRYLEYFILYHYKTCIIELKECDLVGVLWRGFGTKNQITPNVESHFSGNFWWAKAKYIAMLGAPREGQNKRCNAEFWIGKGEGVVLSLNESNINHYKNRWPVKNYNKKITPVYYKVSSSISERI